MKKQNYPQEISPFEGKDGQYGAVVPATDETPTNVHPAIQRIHLDGGLTATIRGAMRERRQRAEAAHYIVAIAETPTKPMAAVQPNMMPPVSEISHHNPAQQVSPLGAREWMTPDFLTDVPYAPSQFKGPAHNHHQ